MKTRSLLLALFSLNLVTACSASHPDKVEQIHHLQVPLVLPGDKPPSIPASHIAALYQENKVQIDRLSAQLKSEYLQHATAKDIFTKDSPVQPVYASLTKLEQLEMINQQYLKDKNVTGLQKIKLALDPLVT
ncbi:MULTISPECIES: hypothetical protein [Enterobacter]|uniref:hypothetical protein n=1 Tax=Enterobacter TaxID=547 RepID=UPI001866485B|nr:hypothetical protein [Enterobacter bugandensis]MBE3533745.1 hypothetical protein [Enterobacter cloacae complex sp. I3]MBO0402703.1 hypothetical protein [Enterobacter bugandensis]MCK7116877.1 hypothetical protein [Enterobacter bugandensis]MCK7133196.1 hypothetical protein [Enterobacter bugandensis]MCK7313625.1 hypothetical protein [Enterobacter bugandensis]